MGNDAACKIAGIGTVNIKMFNGSYKKVIICEVCAGSEEEFDFPWHPGLNRVYLHRKSGCS